MTASKILLDSSAWIEYFLTGKQEIKQIVESNKFILVTSVLSIFEVKRKLLKECYQIKGIDLAIKFMKVNSLMKDITEEICEKAAEDCHKKALHMADGIIYRTALEESAKLVTLDSDFKNLANTMVLE